MDTEGRTLSLGPLAVRLLARRRRWLRWTAGILAILAIASAISHAAHRTAPRAAAVTTVAARRALRAGQVVGPRDVEVRPDGSGSAAPAGSAGGVRDVVGRVAARDLRAGETVTARDVVPVLRYYGVAARVPPGMRAVNLVVSPAATFGGALAPRSRVDLIGAFEPSRGDAAVSVLATGFVLRLAPAREAAARETAVPLMAGSPAVSPAAPVEIEIAVPESSEREIALAQAFGRIFVAVHSAFASATRAAAGAGTGALTLRHYLELPSPRAGTGASGPVSVIDVVPGAALPARGGSSGSRTLTPPCCRPAVGASSGGRPSASHAARPAAGARPASRSPEPLAGNAASPPWVVDVIEGGRRFYEAVPRAGAPGRPIPSSEGAGR